MVLETKNADPKGGLPLVFTSLNPPSSRAQRTRLRPRVIGALKLILCLYAAATLSAIVSSPWSFLRSRLFFTVQLPSQLVNDDPASEFKDDVFPLRPLAPWDISTDFPYPRLLQYDVEEGTWLRLDVHPKTGDIVFDMAGDLYCLPGAVYAQSNAGVTKAHPILVGVPQDAEPHFSPEGDRLVFKSDAELGVDNIWVTKWLGCEDMDVRSGSNAELSAALALKDHEGELLAKGIKETDERKRRRLLREGRLGAQRVTNETHNWVSDARFHPSGSKVIATKWYFSTRSIGAGEGWEYAVPDLGEGIQKHQVKENSGTRVISKTLPLGWTKGDYIEQQIGHEQFLWAGGDKLIFAKNVRDTDGSYTYSKDVHKGIYSIFSRNLTTGETETLVGASPGGASRPELSRDGRTLAFVRRVRDKEALVLKDLQTGTLHHIWHGLTYDRSTIYAPMGTYPSFAFSPTDDAVIIWAAGQIYSVPLTRNSLGEKVAGGTPTPIRFRAHIEKRLAETRSSQTDIFSLETQDTQRLHAFKELNVDHSGRRAVFQAAGVTYVQEIGTDAPVASKVPVLHADAAYYSPSFVHGADELIIHARWSNTKFTSIELANLADGTAFEVGDVPMGRYYSPVLCECVGSERSIAFVKTGGDLLTGDVVATAGQGLYLGEITLPSSATDKVAIRNLRFVPSEIDVQDEIKLAFIEKNKKLLVQQSDRAFVVDLSTGPDAYGAYAHQTLATGKATAEIVVAPRAVSKGDGYAAQTVAFVNFFHVYLAPGSAVDPEQPVWSKPGNATRGLARLSLDGGHSVTFSRDGKRVFWFLGPYLHSLEVAKLGKCSKAIRDDPSNFGVDCVKEQLEYQEVIVQYLTDITRLKEEARSLAPANVDSDVVVIKNATILTMNTGNPARDLVQNGVIIVRGGVIESVSSIGEVAIPGGATVIDAEGGYVLPGFLDVHAHWSGTGNKHPATSWELETFLAYGVTTVHNPSLDNTLGFIERGLVESGQIIGPRIFHTGDVIYGGSDYTIHQDIADSAEARSALIRIKVEGGPSSFSYKNYNLPSRTSRQRLLLAARNLSMLCVPEGGMNYDWDLTYIIDGMTTIEHNLPVSPLYDDVLNLYALSGTGATPTHIVDYGGMFGEQYLWWHHDVPNDPKLRNFVRHDMLEVLSESTSRPMNSIALFNVSSDIAKMVDRGLSAHIGAHGEPPLGLMYHQEMFYAKAGGLSNYEVIRAATSSAARTFGIFDSLGSLAPGKLADLLVYPAGVDLLNGEIQLSQKLKFVMRGGRVWEADTMTEVFPVKRRKQTRPPFNAE
ncbi:hypothetical protein BV22DRAFT_1005502 [Leucogyrophana mollusca]|uniref:Uncharacterized protein n=1 Tax=Leucogyrophana mollusca TaxID=85980 RepID=A0ACB8BT12_9AGAM|nr:hypothetical protein BV22DRAFT_1005502 [Leucogyrophana mollusca]